MKLRHHFRKGVVRYPPPKFCKPNRAMAHESPYIEQVQVKTSYSISTFHDHEQQIKYFLKTSIFIINGNVTLRAEWRDV